MLCRALIENIATVPVGSSIFEPQRECCKAIPESTRQTDSKAFIVFMVRLILAAITVATPSPPKSAPGGESGPIAIFETNIQTSQVVLCRENAGKAQRCRFLRVEI